MMMRDPGSKLLADELNLKMPVRAPHNQQINSVYFITFTCYKWKNLFAMTNAYDTVYKWFDSLGKKNTSVLGYVIMPNHLHVILHFAQMPQSLNTVVGNAKRFMAYEIIKRLEAAKENDMLDWLQSCLKKKEKDKGQRHKVFEDSFDAKECLSMEFILQKLFYIHHNPVSNKWSLVNDFAEYEYSSASFYEKGIKKYEKLVHII
jgi:REP element-mobilizing transposase RayT